MVVSLIIDMWSNVQACLNDHYIILRIWVLVVSLVIDMWSNVQACLNLKGLIDSVCSFVWAIMPYLVQVMWHYLFEWSWLILTGWMIMTNLVWEIILNLVWMIVAYLVWAILPHLVLIIGPHLWLSCQSSWYCLVSDHSALLSDLSQLSWFAVLSAIIIQKDVPHLVKVVLLYLIWVITLDVV